MSSSFPSERELSRFRTELSKAMGESPSDPVALGPLPPDTGLLDRQIYKALLNYRWEKEKGDEDDTAEARCRVVDLLEPLTNEKIDVLAEWAVMLFEIARVIAGR
jgi:hypothetical protein